MQFSKRVADLSRLHNIEPKDVLLAMLVSAGASMAEAFAVIFRPAASSNSGLSSKASQYIGQRPALRRLIDELSGGDASPAVKRGRPRMKPAEPVEVADAPLLDYTDKDAVLQELARIAGRSEKDSDRLAAIREISALQRMKQEAAVEDERRVIFYIPLSYDRCEELRAYLARYYAEREQDGGAHATLLQ